MSTFRPAASSLANFNDTLLMISTIRHFIYISCSHQDKNQRLSWHHSSHSLGIPQWTPSQHGEPTPESKISTFHPVPSSLVNFSATIVQYRRSLRLTLLSCTHATKKASWFWRCGQFLPSLLSAHFLAVLEISVCAY